MMLKILYFNVTATVGCKIIYYEKKEKNIFG